MSQVRLREIHGLDEGDIIRSIHAVITDNTELPAQFRAICVCNGVDEAPNFDPAAGTSCGMTLQSDSLPRGCKLVKIANAAGFRAPVVMYTNDRNPDGQVRLHCLSMSDETGQMLTLGSTYRGRIWEEAEKNNDATKSVTAVDLTDKQPIAALRFKETTLSDGKLISLTAVRVVLPLGLLDAVEEDAVQATGNTPNIEEHLAAPAGSIDAVVSKAFPNVAQQPRVVHHPDHQLPSYGADAEQWCYIVKLIIASLLFIGVLIIMVYVFRRGNRIDPRDAQSKARLVEIAA